MYRIRFRDEDYELHTPHLGALAALALGLTFGLALKPWASDFESSGGPQQVYSDRTKVAPDYGTVEPQYASYGSGRNGPVPEWVTGTYWRKAAETWFAGNGGLFREDQPAYREARYEPEPAPPPAYEVMPAEAYFGSPEPHFASIEGDAGRLPSEDSYRQAQAQAYRAAQERQVGVTRIQGWREVDDLPQGANKGAVVGKPPAQLPSFDRRAEFDDADRAQDADVGYAGDVSARVQSFEEPAADPRDFGGGISIGEHIQRTVGGAAG